MTDYSYFKEVLKGLYKSGDITPEGEMSPLAIRQSCNEYALEVPQAFPDALNSWSQELMTYYLQANQGDSALAYELLGRKLTDFVNQHFMESGCPFNLVPKSEVVNEN